MGNDMEKMLEMLMAMLGNSNEEEELNEISSRDDDNELEEIDVSQEMAEDDADGGLNLESLMDGFVGGKDKRVTLLSSIKPYMNEKRQEKVDVAINLVRLISMSSSLGINLFDIGR